MPATYLRRELHSVAGGMPHGNLWGRRLCRVLTAGYGRVLEKGTAGRTEGNEHSSKGRDAKATVQNSGACEKHKWMDGGLKREPGALGRHRPRTSGTQKATPSMRPPEEAYSTISASICSFSRAMMADRTSFTCTRRTRRASPQAGHATTVCQITHMPLPASK